MSVPPAVAGGHHCRGPHVSKGVTLNATSRRIATAFMPWNRSQNQPRRRLAADKRLLSRAAARSSETLSNADHELKLVAIQQPYPRLHYLFPTGRRHNFPMFVPSHRECDKRDKVGQKSAFWRPAVTIIVTIVKDQGVQHMFTPSLRVYHTCQALFCESPFELPWSLDRGSRPSKTPRRRLATLQCGRACPTVTRLRNIGACEARDKDLSAASRLRDLLCETFGRASPTALRCGEPPPSLVF